MLKKLLISVVAVCVLLTTVVSALEIGDDFYLYGRDDKRLAATLDMTEEEVKAYCTENNITLLAVNKDNTKQIREVVCETEFSKTVTLISSLFSIALSKLSIRLSFTPSLPTWVTGSIFCASERSDALSFEVNIFNFSLVKKFKFFSTDNYGGLFGCT